MKVPVKAVLTGAAIGAVLAGSAAGIPEAVAAVRAYRAESELQAMAMYGVPDDLDGGAAHIDPFGSGHIAGLAAERS